MRLGLWLALTAIAACGGPVRLSPDADCHDELQAETWRGTIAEALAECTLMLRLTIDSYVEPPLEPEDPEAGRASR